MTELDQARRASELAWEALDKLKEADRLLGEQEGLPPPALFAQTLFAEAIDGIVRRMEKEAERRWRACKP